MLLHLIYLPWNTDDEKEQTSKERTISESDLMTKIMENWIVSQGQVAQSKMFHI